MSGFSGQVEADVLHSSDVVNNLTSTATDAPLSAAQGKALKTLYDGIAPILVESVSGTTDANGNLALPALSSGRARSAILFAWNGVYVFIPFYYNGNWYVHVQKTDATGTAITSTNVTCNYYYI